MHYGFWGNEYFTAPDTPDVAYPEGFQGNEIPIGTYPLFRTVRSALCSSPISCADGKIVAELIHARLSIEVTAEAEGEVHDLIHMEGEEEKIDGLDDETDPEVMDAEEEEI